MRRYFVVRGGQTLSRQFQPPVRILLVALYSERHPAIGESHALAILGGCLETKLGSQIEVELVDLYAVQGDRRKILLDTIKEFQPHILGISTTYGSYEFLEDVYPDIQKVRVANPSLTVFGGPLATYVPRQFLEEIDPSAIVVIGEGDDAIVKITQKVLERSPVDTSIPNLIFFMDGQMLKTQRACINLHTLPMPKRKLSGEIFSMGGQVFLESSRGCSWGRCTFCNRGLIDLDNGEPWRRCTVERVVSDLKELQGRGVTEATFADEDFIGGDIQSAWYWFSNLFQACRDIKANLHYYVSVRPKSIYSAKWSNNELNISNKLWNMLRQFGVRKAFLGIESASESQLQRYGKSMEPEEAIGAIQMVRQSGMDNDIGFIIFDPLCTLNEIRENINFIKTQGIVGAISAVDNELRIHEGSRYLSLLRLEENKRGIQLFERPFCKSTLTYKPLCAYPTVRTLIEEVRVWREGWHRM
ncbi:TPA: radical SAM protein, partial [Candidatus Poribacteria bacterium]|nr:radical SAM protein [Candidatus Poribacteria bacterium]